MKKKIVLMHFLLVLVIVGLYPSSVAANPELVETGRLLAILLDSGRVTVGSVQALINDPNKGEKGFTPEVFRQKLLAKFKERSGIDLQHPPQAAALLATFGLRGFEGARPAALSGGMRQRVALARTILTGRRALLLDEPFGALDALTRLEMQQWLLGVWARLGATVVLVTHDLEEAVHLSDRVYAMSARPGRIVDEVAITLPRPRPEDVVATPAFAALKGRLLAAVRAAGRGEIRP